MARAGMGAGLLAAIAAWGIGAATANARNDRAHGPGYGETQLKAKSFFGVRLGMPLAEARAALLARRFRRDAGPVERRRDRIAYIGEAEYVHPRLNTHVSLAYSNFGKVGQRVSRIFLWDEIPRVPERGWRHSIARRYGRPTAEVSFQGAPVFIWGPRKLGWDEILLSRQCLMDCLQPQLIGRCHARDIAGAAVMTGQFNSNDPRKLYFAIELDDLAMQKAARLGGGEFPLRPKLCPPGPVP